MKHWSTLSRALQETIGTARVTHALFTTFGFEPEFFEAHLVPLLLGCTDNMSLHPALRRLQLNEQMCATPAAEQPGIEVYFDASASEAGVPWLPYALHPVRQQGAFHGKVVLLRLVYEGDGDGTAPRTAWVLGSGSANLTYAGWWENIEVWHFTQPFAADAVPSDIFGDLDRLLRYLAALRTDAAHPVVDAWLADAPRGVGPATGSPFMALLPSDGPDANANASPGGRFLDRFAAQMRRLAAPPSAQVLEVVSPYFPDDDLRDFARQVQERLRLEAIRVWLPVDVWQGRTGLLSEPQYRELQHGNDAAWCAFVPGVTLCEVATPADIANRRPRRTHAKVLRLPSLLNFIGSVNFSRAAFDMNFEAGFFFPGTPGNWLVPDDTEPGAFLPPADAPPEAMAAVAAAPAFDATFDWTIGELAVSLAPRSAQNFGAVRLAWRPDHGGRDDVPLQAGRAIAHVSLTAHLASYPAIAIVWEMPAAPAFGPRCDANRGVERVWVHQRNLQYRPVPPELKLDVWGMIDLWRSTRGARIGSASAGWSRLEELLSRQDGFKPDVPEASGEREDLFATMTRIHGAFQGLRRKLLPGTEPEANAAALASRVHYYLRTDRTDSLPTLLERLAGEEDAEALDEVERWVILHWIKQIAADHKGVGDCVDKRAQALIAILTAGPLAALGADRLDWLARAFLDDLGADADDPTRDLPARQIATALKEQA
ncbi:hypothetical protein [Cupriavidus sp. 8B]